MKRSREFSPSLFAITNIKKGDHFTEMNIRSIRPGYGLEPKYIKQVLGKKASCDIERGTPINWKLLI